MASFFRLSCEYAVKNLTIAKYTCKNVLFLSHNGLDPRQIDLFLYASIPFKILYQYQYVVQPDRLHYVAIKTSLTKTGLWISMKYNEGKHTGRTEMT